MSTSKEAKTAERERRRQKASELSKALSSTRNEKTLTNTTY